MNKEVFLHPIYDNVELELETAYFNTMEYLYSFGKSSADRTGTGTKRATEAPKIYIPENFVPLLRGKYINPNNALTELIWIMTGRNDLEFLKVNGVNYWDSWVKDDGTFGPIYGPQMRNQNGFDQLLYVLETLKNKPESRQAMINLWYGADLEKMSLPPCHNMYQPLIIEDTLYLRVYQRSVDTFVGLPYDFMLFYLFKEIISYLLNVKSGSISISFGDYHFYNNHEEQLKTYQNNLFENPKNINFEEKINMLFDFPERPKEFTSESITDWLYEFYSLNKNLKTNYEKNKNCYGLIKTPVAV